jgi:hypothetical protein
MASYVKSTNFAVKDGLPSGDPLKVVKGTEIDTEFNNISTAVNSKADSSNPTFLGTPFAPTASPGTATNQIATTAFVQAAAQAALQSLHPVGSIYINATNSANPSTYFGFGTWVAFGAGRVPVGFNASDALFNAAEKTGGSKDAIVVSHTHTFSGTTGGQSQTHSHTVNDPGHLHSGLVGQQGGTGYPVGQPLGVVVENMGVATTGITLGNASQDHTHGYSGTTSSTGSSGTNANLQPYITVYMWKRTA